MNFKQLCTDMSKEVDVRIATDMAKVFGNRFSFKGLDASARARVIADQIETARAEESEIDWEFVDVCWEQNIREFQYFALSYLMAMRQLMQKEDLSRLKDLIVDKPEWDTNNILHKLVNIHTAYYPELEEEVAQWASAADPWLRRTAILHQLSRAQYTDWELLEKILDANIGYEEEVVQEAILIALADVATSNPDFVRQYYLTRADQIKPELANALDKLL